MSEHDDEIRAKCAWLVDNGHISSPVEIGVIICEVFDAFEEIASLKAQLKREMDCVDFYAKEQNWRTTQGYRAYGSSKGLCINKDDMSNGNYGGKLARETVKARGL